MKISEEEKQLMSRFKEETDKNAIWAGKITKGYKKWKEKLKGQTIGKKSKPKYPHTGSTMSSLENRVGMLEKQVKFLMSKMDGVEIKLAQGESFNLTNRTGYSTDIGSIIKAHVKSRESITIDKLIQLNELQKFSLNSIEQAIITLIDNEVFDVSHGGSIQKIGGNIGRLIRR